MLTLKNFLYLLILMSSGGCSILSGPDLKADRFLACPRDTVWEGIQEYLSAYPIIQKNKDEGIIETDWLEQAVQGQPYGLFGREGLGDKERSRLTVHISSLSGNVVKVQLTERRQHWGFRGGGQIYKWYPIAPSQENLHRILNPFIAQLEKEGCLVES